MGALKPYKTHTGLTIHPPHKDDDGQFVVSIEGDRVKEFFRGNLAAATVAFNNEVEAYKARKVAEA